MVDQSAPITLQAVTARPPCLIWRISTYVCSDLIREAVPFTSVWLPSRTSGSHDRGKVQTTVRSPSVEQLVGHIVQGVPSIMCAQKEQCCTLSIPRNTCLLLPLQPVTGTDLLLDLRQVQSSEVAIASTMLHVLKTACYTARPGRRLEEEKEEETKDAELSGLLRKSRLGGWDILPLYGPTRRGRSARTPCRGPKAPTRRKLGRQTCGHLLRDYKSPLTKPVFPDG